MKNHQEGDEKEILRYFSYLSQSFSIRFCILVQNTKNEWRKLFGQQGRPAIDANKPLLCSKANTIFVWEFVLDY